MIAPARRVAYRILIQIATTEAHSDALLREPEVDALSAVDRALTTTLVLGTLRWQLALDARIGALLTRPEMELSPEAATALRMGAYQLLYLERVPAHAVVHDAVELMKRTKERGAAGLVNAVLRKIQRSALSVQRSGSSRAGGAAEIAARWAHPAWIVERWVRRYGLERAEAICRWDQEPAGVALRVEPGTEIAGVETAPGYFLTAARRAVRGDLSAAVRTGKVRIQDEASQLVAEGLAVQADQTQPMGSEGRGAGLRVLDLCAAPGGKTAVLAERLPESEITAVDVSRQRVLAAQGLARMGGGLRAASQTRVHWEVADAAALKLEPEWDLILCDVPCSGTGTMGRNPEIRLRVTEGDWARQAARQRAILRNGLRGLKAGGRLVYSTCSMEQEENEDVVEEVLRGVAGVHVVPAEGVLDVLAARGVVTAEGRERLRTAAQGPYLRTVPGVHPCDGFFAAVLERDS